MEKILDKINNHQYLNNGDIARFIHVYSNGKIKTYFLDNVKEELGFGMGYISQFSSIIIDKKIKDYNLELLLKMIKKDKKECNLIYLVDFCNIYLINSLFHELEHSKQFDSVNKTVSYKTKLIEESIKFIYISPKLYSKNHDLYYHEYDALIKAYIKTLKVINDKCVNLDENSIVEFNRIIARIIHHSYGNKYKCGDDPKIYEKFNSPICYSKFLSKLWNTPKERKILSKYVKKLEEQSTTEYIKLLNGLKLSGDVIDLLDNIFRKQISTKNIFDEVKKIQK